MIGPRAERLAYTVQEAADLLGVGPDTVWGWTRSGDLPSQKLGRRVLIPASALPAPVGGVGAITEQELATLRLKAAKYDRIAEEVSR